MKKLGLLPRLILGIILGIVIGNLNLPSIVRILATFNSIFGNFLGFTIPLIIVGFIIPGIADLGKSAGKLLGVTTLIAYCSTVIAGCLAFFTNHALLSHIISPDMARDLANPEKGLLHPFFTIDMPPLMGVMSALLIAFILGIGIAVCQDDLLRKGSHEFQRIIEKLIASIIIPLLPLHICGIFANMTHAGQVAAIMSVFAKVFLVIICLHIVILVVQYTLAGSAAGGNPIKLLKGMLPSLHDGNWDPVLSRYDSCYLGLYEKERGRRGDCGFRDSPLRHDPSVGQHHYIDELHHGRYAA